MLSKLKTIHQASQFIEIDIGSSGSDNSHESFDETMKKDDQDYHHNLSQSSTDQIDNIDKNIKFRRLTKNQKSFWLNMDLKSISVMIHILYTFQI